MSKFNLTGLVKSGFKGNVIAGLDFDFPSIFMRNNYPLN